MKNIKEIDEILLGSRYMEQKGYWETKLSTDIIKTELQWGYKRTPGKTGGENEMEEIGIPIAAEMHRSLMKLSKQSDASIYIFLLALVKVLIYRYTNNKDIIVISPLYEPNRTRDTINNLVYIRDHVDDDMTFLELLLNVRQSVLEAYENQDYTAVKLIEYLFNPGPSSGSMHLSGIVCLLKNIHEKRMVLDEKTWLIFCFERVGEQVSGHIIYDKNSYETYYMEMIARHFALLMSCALQDIRTELSSLSFISNEERKQVIEVFNSTEAEYPEDKTIHELFEQQVEKTPKNIALTRENRQLTYERLNAVVNQLAGHLRERGVIGCSIVGIMADCSLEAVVGILAILKAGGVFLPIDSDSPAARKQYQLKDSAARLLVTYRSLYQAYQDTLGNFSHENVFFVDDENLYTGSPANLESNNRASDPVYVIYTSGTTGKPKGVVIEHRGLVNYIWWAKKQYVKNEAAHFPLYTSIAFDLTITSIFTPLLSGNTVMVYGEDYRELLLEKIFAENKVGVIKMTPTHLKMIRDKKVEDSNVKCFILGGEELRSDLASAAAANFNKKIEIYNEYGPTETTIGCMIYRFLPQRLTGKSVPIGKPADNAQIYICDRNLEPVPVGLSGEILVGGHGVARGYLNNPELTGAKFLHLTLNTKHLTLYRTGDLARFFPDGNGGLDIEFLGRIDNQVKIRGFRIELGEIEHHLVKHSQVKEACIMVREAHGETNLGSGHERDKYLCAYIVSDRQFTVGDLREYLAGELPDYMIPSFFVRLDKIPVTTNGKIDKHALPSPDGSIGTGVEYVPPRSQSEKLLAKIWEEVLDISSPGIHDDFFNLGGNSLKLIKLYSFINNRYPNQVSVQNLFDYRTINQLASLLEQGAPTTAGNIEKDANEIKSIDF